MSGKVLFLSCFLFLLTFFHSQKTVFAPIFFTTQKAEAQSNDTRQRLERELQEIERQIANQERQLQQTRRERTTLQNRIQELRQQANKLRLQINANNKRLSSLNIRIQETAESIIQTNNRINEAKNNLVVLVQSMYQMDQTSVLEIVFTENRLSNFFDYLNVLHVIQGRTKENVVQLQDLKKTLDEQNQKLVEDREEVRNLLTIQSLQRSELDNTTRTQENLLRETRGEETRFQTLLTESQRRATEIRNRIFDLVGVQTQVTFGEAVEIANWAGQLTGIRPAFILAILQQESAIGRNVGQCFLADTTSGASVHRTRGTRFQNGMNPRRDIPPFLTITTELGKNPLATQISCPMSFGWGGAMGPAQFIPSTWLSVRERVANLRGREFANPWDVRDSFLASAVYLGRLGATQRTRNAEWRAAMRYFSGSVNLRFRFYGDSVMTIADRFERDISDLRTIAQN